MLTDVVEGVQLAGVQEDAALDIGRERVVLVGVPQTPDHLDGLERPAVTRRVVEVLVQAVVPGGPGVEACHHVPAGPAAADVVQRAEPAGQVEG